MPSSTRIKRLAAATALSAGVAIGAPPPASAGETPRLRACGNVDAGGLLIGDITTKRVRCAMARRIARRTIVKCGTADSCRVLGFACLVARATDELSFARCSRPSRDDELHRVVRFDYGS